MMAVTAFPAKLGHTSSWQVTNMFRLNENTRVKLMIIHGFAMLALGLSSLLRSCDDDKSLVLCPRRRIRDVACSGISTVYRRR